MSVRWDRPLDEAPGSLMPLGDALRHRYAIGRSIDDPVMDALMHELRQVPGFGTDDTPPR